MPRILEVSSMLTNLDIDIFVTDNVYECFEEIRTVALISGFYLGKSFVFLFSKRYPDGSNLVYSSVTMIV